MPRIDSYLASYTSRGLGTSRLLRRAAGQMSLNEMNDLGKELNQANAIEDINKAAAIEENGGGSGGGSSRGRTTVYTGGASADRPLEKQIIGYYNPLFGTGQQAFINNSAITPRLNLQGGAENLIQLRPELGFGFNPTSRIAYNSQQFQDFTRNNGGIIAVPYSTSDSEIADLRFKFPTLSIERTLGTPSQLGFNPIHLSAQYAGASYPSSKPSAAVQAQQARDQEQLGYLSKGQVSNFRMDALNPQLQGQVIQAVAPYFIGPKSNPADTYAYQAASRAGNAANFTGRAINSGLNPMFNFDFNRSK